MNMPTWVDTLTKVLTENRQSGSTETLTLGAEEFVRKHTTSTIAIVTGTQHEAKLIRDRLVVRANDEGNSRIYVVAIDKLESIKERTAIVFDNSAIVRLARAGGGNETGR